MKFKYLFTLPLVALLASCGNNGGTPYPVSQKLPGDVEVVDKTGEEGELSPEYEEYLDDLLDGLFYFDFHDALYHASLDAKVSFSSSYISVNASVKGDVYLAYSQIAENMHCAYASIQGLDLSYKMSQSVQGQKLNMAFSGKDVDLTVYLIEDGEDCVLYADVTDEGLKDLGGQILEQTMGVEKGKGRVFLDSLLAELLGKENPGYANINLTNSLGILDGKLEAAWKPEEHEGKPYESQIAPIKANPLTAALTFASSYVNKFISSEDFQQTLAMATGIIKAVGPALGIKVADVSEGETGLEKVSVAYTGSVKDAMKKGGASEEEISKVPNVRFGAMISVGMENGSEDYAIQELALSLDGKINIESAKISVQANLGLEIFYGEEVKISFPESYEAYTNVPMLEGQLADFIYKKISE